MNNHRLCIFRAIAGTCLLLSLWGSAQTALQSPQQPEKEKTMAHRANGTFEVKVSPQKPDNQAAETANLGRYSLEKDFHGDIEGTSRGEMLTAATEVKGSAGYVALERVTGTLQGRKGSFVLQHNGTMTQGTPDLRISVVPDSGTDQLTGLTGAMNIKIADGKHSYEFDYTLPVTK